MGAAALTADLVIRMGHGLTLGQVVPSPRPLIPNIDITGVLAASHPYSDDDLDTLRDENGTVELPRPHTTPRPAPSTTTSHTS